MKKIICIYLVLVMILTGCGKARRLTGGSDTTIKQQDENKNEKSDNNSGKEIVPQDPTPSPTPTPTPEPSSPPTGGKDGNKTAEKSLTDTVKNFFFENTKKIAIFFVQAMQEKRAYKQSLINAQIQDLLAQQQDILAQTQARLNQRQEFLAQELARQVQNPDPDQVLIDQQDLQALAQAQVQLAQQQDFFAQEQARLAQAQEKNRQAQAKIQFAQALARRIAQDPACIELQPQPYGESVLAYARKEQTRREQTQARQAQQQEFLAQDQEFLAQGQEFLAQVQAQLAQQQDILAQLLEQERQIQQINDFAQARRLRFDKMKVKNEI